MTGVVDPTTQSARPEQLAAARNTEPTALDTAQLLVRSENSCGVRRSTNCRSCGTSCAEI